MRYRKLTATGDYSFGQSSDDFYINQIECVSQSIQTRLQLNQGDWFLNTSEGTPWNARVLGKSSARTRDLVIKSRISGTTGVVSILSYSATLNVQRQLSITVTVSTTYTAEPVTVAAVI